MTLPVRDDIIINIIMRKNSIYEINVKNMLHIVPFFEVGSINIRCHFSKGNPFAFFTR